MRSFRNVKTSIGLSCIVVEMLLFGSQACFAMSAYRYIDDHGVVTYAAEPPAQGHHYQIVTLNNEIPVAEKTAANEQRDRLLAAAAAADSARRKAEEQRSAGVQKLRAKLADAERALRGAQVHSDADWQHLSHGGRHLKPEYFDRVGTFDAEVKRAKGELQKALSSR